MKVVKPKVSPLLSFLCEDLCLTCWVLFKAGGSPPVCSECTGISSMETPLAKQEVEFGISWVFLGFVGGIVGTIK